MFDDLERRYLLQLATECHRNGLSAEDAMKTIRAKLGAFTCAGRLRCAIADVFHTD